MAKRRARARCPLPPRHVADPRREWYQQQTALSVLTKAHSSCPHIRHCRSSLLARANRHHEPYCHPERSEGPRFQQFRANLVEAVDCLLDLMADNPNYGYFTLDGQTVILEDYLEVRPDREQDLRDLVSAGRILVGPWYVMQDEFLVSGESLIRNLLEGRRTAARFSPVNGGRLRSRPFRPHSPTAPSAPWLRHRVSSPLARGRRGSPA